jgi:hypothetical protein
MGWKLSASRERKSKDGGMERIRRMRKVIYIGRKRRKTNTMKGRRG